MGAKFLILKEEKIEVLTISVTVAIWRKKAKLSQVKLAKKAGVAQSTIHRIETAKISPSATVLLRIGDAAGIDLPLYRIETAIREAILAKERGENDLIAAMKGGMAQQALDNDGVSVVLP